MAPIPEAATSLGVALAIGILVGIERERRKGEGPGRAAAGLRTFALVSLAGAIAKLLQEPALLALTATFVVAGALLSYLRTRKIDPGLTTEVALVVTFLLGVMAADQAAMAAGIGVAVALLLASRSRLHRFVREVLTPQELEDFLIFAAAALVVLPLIPNRALGPTGILNLFTMWRLVVIIMGINGAGYVALRVLGVRYGVSLAGFVSGFVSSAATIGAMGTRAKANPQMVVAAVSGAVLSSVATVLQMLLVVGATSVETLQVILMPMMAAGVVSVAYGAISWRRAARIHSSEELTAGRAFNLTSTLLLAATVSVVMATSALLLQWLGNKGLMLAAGLAGFADTHAAAISVASLVKGGDVSAKDAEIPILCGFTSNAATKIVIAYTSGSRQFGGFVMLGTCLTVAAAWVAFVVS